MIGIVLALVPWIAYWLVGGVFGLTNIAISIALVITVVLNLIHRRSPKLLENVSLGYFVACFMLTVLFGSPLLIEYGTVTAGALLAAMANFSIARNSDFIYEYSRDDWPEIFWPDELFRRTNRWIASAWI